MVYIYAKMRQQPKGAQAARLRQHKFEVLRSLELPKDGLPGSLALTHTRCGKPTCHCTSGDGHPGWSLTFMVGGKKHVLRIPREWIDEVRRDAAAGRAFRDAVAEVFAANAQLLALSRKQRRK